MKELIETLYQTFIAEGDVQYLDTAVEMAESLLPLDKSIEFILDHLIGVRNARIAVLETNVEVKNGMNCLLTHNTEPKSNYPETAHSDTSETWRSPPDGVGDDIVELFRTFQNMFTATRERSYLDNALGLVEGLNVVDESIAADVERLRIVRDLQATLDQVKGGEREFINIDNEENLEGARPPHGLGRRNIPDLTADPVEHTVNLLDRLISTGESREDAMETFMEIMFQDKDIQETLRTVFKPFCESRDSEKKAIDTWYKDCRELECLYERYKATSQNDLLECAILLSEHIIISAPSQELRLIGRSTMITLLGNACGLTESMEDLQSDIDSLQGSLKQLPQDDPERPALLATVGMKLWRRYQQSTTIVDLNEAIRLAEEAVRTMPSDYTCRAATLKHLGIMMVTRAQDTGSVADLPRMMEIAEAARTANCPDDPDSLKELENIKLLSSPNVGQEYFRSYQSSGSLEDLGNAIENTQRLLTAIPTHISNSDYYLSVVSGLAQMIYCRYEQLGGAEDLDKSLTLTLEAANATPLDHPDRTERLCRSGIILLSKYRISKLQDDLDQAIQLTREALAATIPGDTNRLMVSANMMRLMIEKHDLLGASDDLVEAIEATEAVISEITPSDPQRSFWLEQLARLLLKKYQKSEASEDIEQALYCGMKALDDTPLGHDTRHERLYCLSSIHFERYQKAGDLEDIAQTIKLMEEAVVVAPLGITQRPKYLSILAVSLDIMYSTTRDLETLQKAIFRAEEAIPIMSQHSPIRIPLLTSLGKLYIDRHRLLKTPQDLEKDIRSFKELSRSILLDSSALSSQLGQFAVDLYESFQCLGDLKNLSLCIELAEEGIELAPADQEDLAKQLSNLGAMFDDRYARVGEPKDLERSFQCFDRSLSLTPQGGSPGSSTLSNLAAHFMKRFSILGALEDLEQGINFGQEAKKVVRIEDPKRVAVLSNLSTALLMRYNRLQLLDDINQAMEYAKLAAKSKSEGHHPFACQALADIAKARYCYYREKGDLQLAVQDLQLAVQWSKEATETLPRDNPDRNLVLSRLGCLLHSRYKHLGDIHDLDDAIMYGEESLALTPRHDPRRTELLILLSSALLSRYMKTNTAHDYYYTLHTSYEGWHCHQSPPHNRMHAAYRVSRLLASKGMWLEMSSVLQDLIKLLPSLSKRSLGRCDQERRLSCFAGVTPDAVSLSLKLGEEAMFCLRILEFGRGIIMGLTIDCRSDSDLSDLQLRYPEIFAKFDWCRKEIDAPIIKDSPVLNVDQNWIRHRSSYEKGRRQRELAVHEMEGLLGNIRELPGFEGFQLPPRSDDLIAMASEGPIIIVNCTALRTDAIIVTSTRVESHLLSKVDYESVKQWMSEIPQLVRGKRSTYQRRNERMEELLLWLWNAVVEPILDKLQLDMYHEDLRRLWWIGTGGLAMAPFHAAGDHSLGSTRNTISRVISSYIPTMKALSFARRRKLGVLKKPDSRLLLVTMPSTPGETISNSKIPKVPSPLRSVLKEVEGIMSAIKGRINTTHLNQPSADDVLKELPSCHAIHFACHGVSDSDSPSSSHLLLRKENNTKEGKLDKLTVEAISATNLENAQIAYLSACSTAQNSSMLVDESIYIASGFQLAGFSHVLATQWVSNDVACQQVALEFYKLLFSGGEEGHRQVSVSFHHAVKRLRDRNLRQPILWACYIHTGA